MCVGYPHFTFSSLPVQVPSFLCQTRTSWLLHRFANCIVVMISSAYQLINPQVPEPLTCHFTQAVGASMAFLQDLSTRYLPGNHLFLAFCICQALQTGHLVSERCHWCIVELSCLPLISELVSYTFVWHTEIMSKKKRPLICNCDSFSGL